MPDWSIWMIVAIVFLIGEVVIFSGFILGPLAVAAIAASLAAMAGASVEVQLAVFAIGGVLSLLVLRPLAKRAIPMPEHTRTNADALVGMSALVLRDIERDTPGLVRLGSEDWTAAAVDDKSIETGARVIVTAIKGATAVVQRESDGVQ
ncbi:MAG: NfeD family protein [Thermoleophilaceae bacterium]|nr:NfeD family protein [Thermoleophilaceae bacterium]